MYCSFGKKRSSKTQQDQIGAAAKLSHFHTSKVHAGTERVSMTEIERIPVIYQDQIIESSTTSSQAPKPSYISTPDWHKASNKQDNNQDNNQDDKALSIVHDTSKEQLSSVGHLDNKDDAKSFQMR